jgi:hypothetical protein
MEYSIEESVGGFLLLILATVGLTCSSLTLYIIYHLNNWNGYSLLVFILTAFQCFRSALQEALFQNDSISTSLSPPALDHRYPPKRLWIVSGTGFLANVLHSLWPTTEFLIIPADISVWSKTDVVDKKHQIFYPNQPFPAETSLQPPYPTIPWYDAKLWQFVLQHGQNGDYIWNVGRLL